MINDQATANVFNIQSYCIHDGPGIRSTVFVKGCPLRCLWCANPESQSSVPELMVYNSKCVGCGSCVSVCPQAAITVTQQKNRLISSTDRTRCTNCGNCTAVCPHKARELAGSRMTVRDVLDVVKKDVVFYNASGGGMTISGGEPLSHPDFTENLLAAARAEGIHTAIESSCYAPLPVIERVFAHVDLALLDVKHMDDKIHKQLTGVSNAVILENIRHIYRDLGVPIILRVPTIPGCNDNDGNMQAVGRFAASLGNDVSVHLLPYHRLGDSKSESLGRARDLGIRVPEEEHMKALQSIIERYGVPVQLGG